MVCQRFTCGVDKANFLNHQNGKKAQKTREGNFFLSLLERPSVFPFALPLCESFQTHPIRNPPIVRDMPKQDSLLGSILTNVSPYCRILPCLNGYPQVYSWGSFEEDEAGEQYFQNLPTTSSLASPALPCTSSSLGQPSPRLTPPSPSPSPHLSNTDALGEAGGNAVKTVLWQFGFLIFFYEGSFLCAAAYYPGKCMAHTSSTYTFTTCRILHPTDEQTRVTPR